MAYSIRFKRRARTELDECCETYGEAFRNDIWDWLRNIATAAESNDNFDSIDVVELLDEAMEHDEQQWRYALRRGFSAKLPDKIKASFVVVKKRCLPWRLSFAEAWFQVLGRFDCSVGAHFVIDHVNKQVVFVLFDGLPGQP